MMQQGEYALLNTQLALFFKNVEQRPDKWHEGVNTALGDLFKETPIIVPIPNDRELDNTPVVQMVSDIYQLNIARARADFFLTGKGKQTFAEVQEDFFEKTKKFTDFFVEKTEVKRIGFIQSYYISSESPSKYTAQILQKEFVDIQEGGENMRSVSVDCIKRFSYNEFVLNTRVNIQEARNMKIVGEVEAGSGVVLTIDFNTIPEQDYTGKLTSDSIRMLIDYTAKGDVKPEAYIEKFFK